MTENIFMRYFREKNNLSQEAVANVLHMSKEQYAELEAGKSILKFETAKHLDAFFKSETCYFYILGLQHQLMATQEELIDLLKKQAVGNGELSEEEASNLEALDESSELEKIPELLLEKVARNPTQVIQEVFRVRDIDSIRDDTWTWIKAAIANNKSSCEEEGIRLTLMTFYKDLLVLLEALHLINEKRKCENAVGVTESIGAHTTARSQNQPRDLVYELVMNPEQVLKSFYEKYTLKQLRFLFWNWLDAGISNEGVGYDEGIERSFLLLLYEHIYCLVEAAYYLNVNANRS
ncbi:helix-turn-helix domain-containing protein [Chitinophaga sancti]|uniref:Helix-turn-helix n=1 Tax=Chitinophaga sancti TaxID=1004 RepID=A0A1K1S951_9BACT|nr:helix-turn-helix transcriptional regulator [Chitinophaga sancti]WQD60993.1 helix-turn-helix transcriptional regulator [Chitinophaga sancti]WQG86880.1 helix-turn-helix transcriptional regulator [Chitinophaga sancti]SFW80604.1 Helix-turn-helix [Chitinophaga sancti]